MMRWLVSTIVLVAIAHVADARRERSSRSISLENYLGTIDVDTTPLELHIDVNNVKARNETAP